MEISYPAENTGYSALKKFQRGLQGRLSGFFLKSPAIAFVSMLQ